jgi:regulatory protein
MDRALGLLSRRDHTKRELEQKLMRPLKSGPSDPVEVQRVIAELEAKGFQSDARAAKSLVTSKGRRMGTLRLRMELQQKGAAPELIASALEGRNDLEVCRQVWRKKFGQKAEDIKAKQKQFRFLASRGFSMDVVRNVLGGVPDESDDFE